MYQFLTMQNETVVSNTNGLDFLFLSKILQGLTLFNIKRVIALQMCMYIEQGKADFIMFIIGKTYFAGIKT